MIPKKRKKPRQPKLSTLQDKADKAMSLYIRQKYADPNGYVKCVSCDSVKPWQEMQAAHCIPKSRGASIRYVEENLHPACSACNMFNPESHMIGYTLAMIDMYGRGKIDELRQEARKVLKPSEKRALCEEAIEYYTQALIDLKH
jgi:hypothetical protein